jgi:cell wall-associated NlpC family hydrolase
MEGATRGALVAAEVEKWNRTPFHEQQATLGRGCDCKGLLWGIARDLGFPEAESFYATFIAYDLTAKGGVPHRLLREGLDRLFDRAEDILPGDVLLLNLGSVPGHLAIASRTPGLAWHAQVAPNAYVKEASLRSLLKMFPLVTVNRWKDC